MTPGFDQLAGELSAAERRLATPRPARARALLLPLATTAVVIAVLAVVLLTGGGGRQRALPGGGGAPASAGGPNVGAGGAWTLPCSQIVGTQAPPRRMRIVLGSVGLPGRPGESRALQTGRDGRRLFGKSGLWVRNGARFALIVPATLHARLTMTWGDAGAGDRGYAMIDPGCRVGHARWLNYVGGYWVTRQLCATLIVSVVSRRRRVRIGIGASCPGQRPPSPPSQTFG
jgi:hypothetical protein